MIFSNMTKSFVRSFLHLRMSKTLNCTVVDEFEKTGVKYVYHENRDMAIAMSSSRADPVLG